MEKQFTISVEQLKQLAIEIIVSFVRYKYGNRENIEEKITEIKEKLENTKISVKKRETGFHVIGTNNKGDITLNIENGILDENTIPGALETLLHELFHSVSDKTEKLRFLEEGSVTYITSLTINYLKEHGFEYKDIEQEKLNNIISKMNAIDGYLVESSVIRTNSIIMKKYGIDAVYEYIMHKDGTEKILEKAEQVSKQYQKLIEQCFKKNTGSQATISLAEIALFKQYLSECPLDLIEKTDVEMNSIIREYITDNVEDMSVDLVRILEENPDLKSRKMFTNQIREFEKNCDLSNYEAILNNTYLDEIINTPEESTAENTFDIQNLFNITDEEQYVIRNMTDYCDKIYLSNVYREIWSILYAYDIHNQNLFDNIDEYLEKRNKETYISIYETFEKQMNANIPYYIELIRKDFEQGKSRKEILEKYLKQSLAYKLIVKETLKNITPENYEDKIIELALLNKKMKDEYNIKNDNVLIGALSIATKKYLAGKSDLSENDLNILGCKLKKAYVMSDVNNLMYEIGNTPESIVIKGIDCILPENEENNILSALNYIVNEDIYCGEYIGSSELDLFALKIRETADKLVSNSDERIYEFMNVFSKCKVNRKFISMDYLKHTSLTSAMIVECVAIKETGSILIDYIVETYKKDRQKALDILTSTEDIKDIFFKRVTNGYYIGTELFSKIATLELDEEQIENAKNNGEITDWKIFHQYDVNNLTALEKMYPDREKYPFIFETLKQTIYKKIDEELSNCTEPIPGYSELERIVKSVIVINKLDSQISKDLVNKLFEGYKTKLKDGFPKIENKYNWTNSYELLDNILLQNEIMPDQSIIKLIPPMLDCVYDLIRGNLEYYDANSYTYNKEHFINTLLQVIENHEMNLMTDNEIISKLAELKEELKPTNITYS